MSDTLQETELKFTLTAQAAARLRTELIGDASEDRLTSTYYDTPNRDLMRVGATLRLRRTDRTWLQTLKGGGGASIARFEDERPATSGVLDPHLFPSRTYRKLGVARPSELQPLFETQVSRLTKRLDRANACIELALDHGSIQAGASKAPIEELELELKTGGLDDLFSAAREFAAVDGVSISLISKSERGHRLAAGEMLTAVKFRPPPLDFDGSAQDGFQTLFLAALHQFSANAEILRGTASVGAVHQARVALRHLKTYLGAFKRLVADSETRPIREALDRLTAVFEEARALDVLQSNAFVSFARHEPGAAGFGAALLSARTRAYSDVETAVRRQDFAQDLFRLIEWALCGPWIANAAEAPSRADRLAPLVRRLTSHRWRALRRLGRDLDWSDPHARHRLRIQIKKMRYLLEVFSPGGSRKIMRRLEALQDQLGLLNDIATAPASAKLALADAPGEVAFAAGSIIGEYRAKTPRHLTMARAGFHKLAKRPPKLA